MPEQVQPPAAPATSAAPPPVEEEVPPPAVQEAIPQQEPAEPAAELLELKPVHPPVWEQDNLDATYLRNLTPENRQASFLRMAEYQIMTLRDAEGQEMHMAHTPAGLLVPQN